MKSLFLLIVLALSSSVFAAEPKCMKAGKEVEVKGATVDAKKAACLSEKGTWSEVKVEASAAAGKTGGW
jgi:hypothetical protein